VSLLGRIVVVWLAAASAFAATPADEVRFAAQDAERYFERNDLLVKDEAASAYLQAVLDRLVAASPDGSLGDCRAFLIRGTHASGFALPTCRVYVSLALFMAIENEAQLASLLSREIAHVRNDSVVRNRRELDRRLNDAVFLSTFFAALGGVPNSGVGRAPGTDAVGDLLWRISVRGFTDEIELQAERDGLARHRAAGFAKVDAVRALERLRDVAPAATDEQRKSLPLLASKPVLDARLARLRLVAGEDAGSGAPPDAAHQAIAQSLQLQQVREFLDTGDRAAARNLLDQHVSAHGDSGRSQFLIGELERRNGRASHAAAIAAYEKGATFADAPAELFLNLGMLLRESGNGDRARPALERFLELEPTSAQADLVRYILSKPSEGK
jgi:predicted Zn-dependent protease